MDAGAPSRGQRRPFLAALFGWAASAVPLSGSEAGACEARLGLANWTRRLDLPRFKEVQSAHGNALGSLKVLPTYTELQMEDFELFRSEAGFVALPKAEKPLFMRIEGAEEGFRLESMQFRMPSEHKVGGRNFAGELQLVHRNKLGAAVVVAMLLEGLRQYKAVPYPTDCPALYVAIDSEMKCKGAAMELDFIKSEGHSVRLRKFKSGHCVLGCYVQRYKDEYSLMLDPEIFNLNGPWGATWQMCKVDTALSDWLQAVVSHAIKRRETKECDEWLTLSFENGCQAPPLRLQRLFPGPMPALRYDSSRLHVRPLKSDAARFTFRMHSRADLGISLDFAEGRPLTITGIDPTGSVALWNRGHPERPVEVGNRIVAVGGLWAPAPSLVRLMEQNKDLDITIAATDVANCPVPLEWLVLAEPLPVHLEGLQRAANLSWQLDPLMSSHDALVLEPALEAEAALTEEFSGNASWSGKCNLDLASFLPPQSIDLQGPLVSVLHGSGIVLLGMVAGVAAFLAWGILRGPGAYEPDLVETTRQASWPLARAHALICAVAWAAVPLLLGIRHAVHAEFDDWRLPGGSGFYVSAAVVAQLLLQIWYVEMSGSARSRVSLMESLELLALDALAIVDLYLDLLFFCIAYVSGSSLCWGALAAFLVGRLVAQWLLGVVLALVACDEPLLHWQPRQMGLMHTIVRKQLLAMQREEEEAKVKCAWVALPALKCALEDAPFTLFQVLFLMTRWQVALPLVALSTLTSAAVGARGAFLAVSQAKELEVSAEEVSKALRALLSQSLLRGPAARDVPGTARGQEEDA